MADRGQWGMDSGEWTADSGRKTSQGRHTEIYKHCNHGLNIACSPSQTSRRGRSFSSLTLRLQLQLEAGAPGGRRVCICWLCLCLGSGSAPSICLRESAERAQSSWINHRGQGRSFARLRSDCSSTCSRSRSLQLRLQLPVRESRFTT